MLASFEDCRPLLVAFVESMAQAQHSDELRAQLAHHLQHIRETVAVTVRAVLGPSAERRGADPEAIASLLIAICDGLTLQWLLDPDGHLAASNSPPRSGPRLPRRSRHPAAGPTRRQLIARSADRCQLEALSNGTTSECDRAPGGKALVTA